MLTKAKPEMLDIDQISIELVNNTVAGGIQEYAASGGADLSNYVDRTTNQTIAGVKSFSSDIIIENSSPGVHLRDIDPSAHDFWLHVNENCCYILTDRTGNGSWDGANPLRLLNDSANAHIYGKTVALLPDSNVWTGDNTFYTGDTYALSRPYYDSSTLVATTGHVKSVLNSYFTGLASTWGYKRLGGSTDMMIQWGRNNSNIIHGQNYYMNFPTSFANQCLSVVAVQWGTDDSAEDATIQVHSLAATGFAAFVDGTNTGAHAPGIMYIAIGY